MLRHIAIAVAARIGDLADHMYKSMLQEFCVVVRSFRARAALCFGYFSCGFSRGVLLTSAPSALLHVECRTSVGVVVSFLVSSLPTVAFVRLCC